MSTAIELVVPSNALRKTYRRLAKALLAVGALAMVGLPATTVQAKPVVSQSSGDAKQAATSAATARLATAERERAQRESDRVSVARAYESQLRAIDALKRQRASWRRDRELREALATSQATAKQLAVKAQAVTTADTNVRSARLGLLVAIDVEMASATVSRKAALAQARRRLSPAVTSGTRRIMLPSGDIDPLADPEELEQQAQLLLRAEAELGRAIVSLDAHTVDLERAAVLRAQHDRAGELVVRDDDSPRRTSSSGGSSEAIPSADADAGAINPNSDGGANFGGEVTAVILRDVVDASTSDLLKRVDRVSDPKAKAAAARQARAQTAARLAKLAAQRAAIEARIRSLRR